MFEVRKSWDWGARTLKLGRIMILNELFLRGDDDDKKIILKNCCGKVILFV